MIVPCIDLMGGKAVQLIQGRKLALEVKNVPGLVDMFLPFGNCNVIDLDAAMGRGNNLGIIKEICSRIPSRVGGGIRSVTRAVEAIAAGAKKVIVGSRAFTETGIHFLFLEELNASVGKDRIIIAIDSKEGKVAVEAWKKVTNLDTLSVVKKLEPYCSGFLYTYVDKEGMMQGTNLDFIKKLRKATSHEIIAAGGISSIEEIEVLDSLGVSSALGMALYTGAIQIHKLLNYKKA